MNMRLIVGLGAAISGVAAASEANHLKEADIRNLIIGKTIYLAAPAGGEFPLNYHISGEVDGNGKAVGLGRLVQPTDTGRWWIQSDKLCQQFKVWYGGKQMCFDLSATGENKVKWVRNDGETGIARIGD